MIRGVNSTAVLILPLMVIAFLACAPDAQARNKLFDDKSGSTAYIELKTQDSAALANALIKVFVKDGYDVFGEGVDQLNFSRPASRMQELSYGTPLSPGSTEVVYVDFFPVDQKTYRVECNVTIMTAGKPSLTDSNVLALFGRQYKRLLRRVKRAL